MGFECGTECLTFPGSLLWISVSNIPWHFQVKAKEPVSCELFLKDFYPFMVALFVSFSSFIAFLFPSSATTFLQPLTFSACSISVFFQLIFCCPGTALFSSFSTLLSFSSINIYVNSCLNLFIVFYCLHSVGCNTSCDLPFLYCIWKFLPPPFHPSSTGSNMY